MKHIFKKLHIGSNHDPNRPTETPSPLPQSVSSPSDHRASAAPASPSTSSPSTATVPSGTPVAVNRQEYYSSEEEYQVQLALALSVSGRDSGDDPEKDQIRAATLLSLGGGNRTDSVRERGEAAADELSRQYWVSLSVTRRSIC